MVARNILLGCVRHPVRPDRHGLRRTIERRSMRAVKTVVVGKIRRLWPYRFESGPGHHLLSDMSLGVDLSTDREATRSRKVVSIERCCFEGDTVPIGTGFFFADGRLTALISFSASFDNATLHNIDYAQFDVAARCNRNPRAESGPRSIGVAASGHIGPLRDAVSTPDIGHLDTGSFLGSCAFGECHLAPEFGITIVPLPPPRGDRVCQRLVIDAAS